MQYRNWLQYQFSFHLFLGGNRLSFQSFHLYRPVLVPGLAPVKGYVLTDSEVDGGEKKPLIAQVKKFLHDNHKPYKDEDKEILRHSYFEQVSKLDKDALKKERYFEFATILCSKIKA